MTMVTRLVEVRQNVLKRNDILARELRVRFRDAGVFVVSMVSSPGSGKTMLLERTLTLLQPAYRVAALVGDLATRRGDQHVGQDRQRMAPLHDPRDLLHRTQQLVVCRFDLKHVF